MRRQASAADTQADLTASLARIEEQRDAARQTPAIVVAGAAWKLRSDTSVRSFMQARDLAVEIANIGEGAALDVSFEELEIQMAEGWERVHAGRSA